MTLHASSRRQAAGASAVELLAAMAGTLLLLGAVCGLLATGGRLLLRAAVRLEADDVVVTALEAFAFDVRRAGWDPTAASIEGLAIAATDTLTLEADLDGNGVIDAGSEERVRWSCLRNPPRLARIVGAQSMPLANSVLACGFGFFDAQGRRLTVAPGQDLDALARRAVRAIRIDLAVRPPGLDMASVRHTIVARRSGP